MSALVRMSFRAFSAVSRELRNWSIGSLPRFFAVDRLRVVRLRVALFELFVGAMPLLLVGTERQSRLLLDRVQVESARA